METDSLLDGSYSDNYVFCYNTTGYDEGYFVLHSLPVLYDTFFHIDVLKYPLNLYFLCRSLHIKKTFNKYRISSRFLSQ